MGTKEDHARLRKAGVTFLAPRALRKLNAWVMERDNWSCRIRDLSVCTGRAEHVHHTLGRAVTGDDPRYMVAACKACNLKVGDPMRSPDPPVVPKAWL